MYWSDITLVTLWSKSCVFHHRTDESWVYCLAGTASLGHTISPIAWLIPACEINRLNYKVEAAEGGVSPGAKHRFYWGERGLKERMVRLSVIWVLAHLGAQVAIAANDTWVSERWARRLALSCRLIESCVCTGGKREGRMAKSTDNFCVVREEWPQLWYLTQITKYSSLLEIFGYRFHVLLPQGINLSDKSVIAGSPCTETWYCKFSWCFITGNIGVILERFPPSYPVQRESYDVDTASEARVKRQFFGLGTLKYLVSVRRDLTRQTSPLLYIYIADMIDLQTIL